MHTHYIPRTVRLMFETQGGKPCLDILKRRAEYDTIYPTNDELHALRDEIDAFLKQAEGSLRHQAQS